MSGPPLVVGVDGGGTKSLGLISDQDGNVLARHEVGASNPNAVGFETAADNLSRVISECCDDARCDVSELGAIVLGLAGAGGEKDQHRMKEALDARLTRNSDSPLPIFIETDARVALEGAFNGGLGVVIIAGTGSVIIGKNTRGEILRVGGWGRVLGDEGSGFHIGREALGAVTLDIDNRGYSGSLRKMFAQKFQWNSRDEIIEAVYRNNFDIPSLAPLVMEAAVDNDVVAQKILDNAATLLVEQASVLVMQMGVDRKIGLVLYGGLVQHGTVYAHAVQTKIEKLFPQVEIRLPMYPPAHGAVLMAIQKLRRK